MIVPDEVVIEALLKDARRFKSKWELNVSEPTRSKPNTKFLKRTLSNVVKLNQERMRRPRRAESYERDLRTPSSSHSEQTSTPPRSSRSRHRSLSRSRQNSDSNKSPKRSKHCSKSKHRSPSAKRKSAHSRSKSSKHKHKSDKKSSSSK